MTNDLLVTKVTENAGVPETLTDDDYRDIYNELRGYHPDTGLFDLTVGKLVKMIDSKVSRAAWWNYDIGKLALSRKMRNELRAAVGQPLLPPTIEDAMADVDPNGAVFQVGEDTPHRVIIIGDKDPLWIHSTPEGLTASRTIATEPPRTPPRPRKRVDRPWVTQEQMQAQESLGVAWKEIIDAGIQALINKSKNEGSDKQGDQQDE